VKRNKRNKKTEIEGTPRKL